MTHQANAADTELASYSFQFYFLFAEKHFLIACTSLSIERNLSVSSPQIIDKFLYNSPLLFSTVRINHHVSSSWAQALCSELAEICSLITATLYGQLFGT